ncbi:MAG: hypothetical protein KAV00_01950 [Phycisphaerae bacterium]|nr:hypothetical protein [Phycisphaerae bacterium]
MSDDGTRPLESVPPKPLDRAELEKAADAAMTNIEQGCSRGILDKRDEDERRIILATLTDIATRAFEQAARVECDELVIGKSTSHHPFFAPAIRLSDACAALDAPPEPARRSVTMDNAEDWYTGETDDA